MQASDALGFDEFVGFEVEPAAEVANWRFTEQVVLDREFAELAVSHGLVVGVEEFSERRFRVAGRQQAAIEAAVSKRYDRQRDSLSDLEPAFLPTRSSQHILGLPSR